VFFNVIPQPEANVIVTPGIKKESIGDRVNDMCIQDSGAEILKINGARISSNLK